MIERNANSCSVRKFTMFLPSYSYSIEALCGRKIISAIQCLFESATAIQKRSNLGIKRGSFRPEANGWNRVIASLLICLSCCFGSSYLPIRKFFLLPGGQPAKIISSWFMLYNYCKNNYCKTNYCKTNYCKNNCCNNNY